MKRLRHLIGAVVVGIRSGHVSVVVHELRRRLWCDWTFYGLSRNLDVPFVAPDARIPLEIRMLRESDVQKLLGIDADPVSARGPHVRMHLTQLGLMRRGLAALRLRAQLAGDAAPLRDDIVRVDRLNFVGARIGTCFVAATTEGVPCYMQWLLPASENAEIRRYFKGIFPVLDSDEALLEFAFTREDYQGNGIMPAAMARIAEKARSHGARRVITFVDNVNVPALKGCQRAGFSPSVIRVDRWRLFRRRVRFHPLPRGTPYPFEP
jgi:GNAT superfamily N-acetyltransferase